MIFCLALLKKYIYVKIPKQNLYIYNDEINFEKHL